MSRRERSTETRTIHPRALHTLGQEAAIIMLEVARDLRSGAIPPDHLYQARYFNDGNPCGTPCCLGGHVAARLGMRNYQETLHWVEEVLGRETRLGLNNLFSADNPSDPILAADAAERYLYDGADLPWAA